MTWGIIVSWTFEPVEIVKETAKMVFYVDRRWRARETRIDRHRLLNWRGSEEDARGIAAKMTSAKAEYERRKAAAGRWYDQRRAEILAAKAMEAGTDKTACGLGPEGDSAVPERDLPK